MKDGRKGFMFLIVVFVLCVLYSVTAEENVFYGQNDHGVGGTIRVAVTMEGDTIRGIKTLEQNETRGLGTTAILQLTKNIISSNSLDVDSVTGATLTSIAFMGAVRHAVEEATGYDPVAFVELNEYEYLGISSNALGGRLMIKVTIIDDKIVSIDVLETYESKEIGEVALKTQIEKMIENNSADVDSITGATITCNALSEALTQAIVTSKQQNH